MTDVLLHWSVNRSTGCKYFPKPFLLNVLWWRHTYRHHSALLHNHSHSCSILWTDRRSREHTNIHSGNLHPTNPSHKLKIEANTYVGWFPVPHFRCCTSSNMCWTGSRPTYSIRRAGTSLTHNSIHALDTQKLIHISISVLYYIKVWGKYQNIWFSWNTALICNQ